MRTRIAFMLLIMCGCIACTPTVSNKAKILLDKATSHYTKGEYNTAKLLIDSIHTTFQHDIETRQQARILMYNIEYQETARNLAYLDSIIPLAKKQCDSMMVDYVLLDTVYVTPKTYRHTYFDKQAPATTLICEITEQGNINIISVNAGKARNHVAIKVSSDDAFADTQEVPVGNAYNYQFTDLGVQWEKVTFDKNTQGDILGFIELYQNHPIYVTLMGEKNYTYQLGKKSIEALAQSVQYAHHINQYVELKKEHHKLTEKLAWIKQKLVAEESPY